VSRRMGSSAATARAAPASSSTTGGEFALYILIAAVAEGILWCYCTFQQLVTTHDAAVGLLQGGILIPNDMTPQQLLRVLQSNMDKYNRIGWAIAFITQALLLSAILPNPLRENIFFKILIIAALVLEVTTDTWYSVATETTLGGAFMWIFNYGSGGWMVSLSYIILMMGGSVFFGLLASYHFKLILVALLRPKS